MTTTTEALALEYVDRSNVDLQAIATTSPDPVERGRVEAVLALRWHATRSLYAATR